MTRRDYTNASGYFCPTENTAIYLADSSGRELQQKPPKHSGVLTERDIAAMDRGRSKRTSLVEYFDSLPQEQQEPKDKPHLKEARQVKAIISQVLSLAGFTLKEMKIEHRESMTPFSKEELEG